MRHNFDYVDDIERLKAEIRRLEKVNDLLADTNEYYRDKNIGLQSDNNSLKKAVQSLNSELLALKRDKKVID